MFYLFRDFEAQFSKFTENIFDGENKNALTFWYVDIYCSLCVALGANQFSLKTSTFFY